MKKVLLILVITGALFFAALNYHFILMDKNVKILKKVELTFDNTFVDAREAKKFKLFLNPSLLKAGIRKALRDNR
ncbi:MAG: hypothetical protein JRD71_02865, partial [Deltaproteobacteria bacterium]|nr:hypothetical protein [Deltaproteobacteria bacterium]